ncbi:hypothetical protein H7K24_05910 [Mycobacterium fragae]|uniref:Uncharacterized protein n=1 Tax=Mycobacterium fragae TaxID=1260918 RepID=A0A1X1V367_9MYCO|nr:hypothetical protein [Mycobacterium fragae]MCV7399686.1 hypothetical protein [Mycobacterium fragae]ORV63536.1 hypothetical protein AWC06_09440 [Mycobacterium fragae]
MNGQHMVALQELSSPAKRSARPSSGIVDRHRLQVIAPGVAEAVTSAGGLIFDRAMAGWDVTVVVDGEIDEVDDRPIRILGARVAPLSPGPACLAVAADMLVKSEAVRRVVLAALNSRMTEVLLWGRGYAPGLKCTLAAVHHRPSAAAHVFKSHALAAGGTSCAAMADEGFFSAT